MANIMTPRYSRELSPEPPRDVHNEPYVRCQAALVGTFSEARSGCCLQPIWQFPADS